MKIRLEGLRREQERLITEMERCIYKHESIAIRNRPKPLPAPAAGSSLKKAAASAEYTSLGVRRKITSLRQTLNNASKETAQYAFNIEQTQGKLQVLTGELEAVSRIRFHVLGSRREQEAAID